MELKSFLKNTPMYKVFHKGKYNYYKTKPLGWVTKRQYKKVYGENLNLSNPVKYSEKINWLKFYYAYDENAILAGDKIGIHKFLKEKKLENLSVPVVGIYSDVEEINWSELPQSFVAKKSNGSGMNIIVKDKKDYSEKEFKMKINSWMKEEFGVFSEELHYKKMIGKIIIEKYFENITEDWKIFFINGEEKVIQVTKWVGEDKKFGKREYVKILTDMQGNILYISEEKSNLTKIKLPESIDEMIKSGRILSKEFPFVRVDYFLGEGKLYLGEMTFTPSAGLDKYNDKVGRIFQKSLNLQDVKANEFTESVYRELL